MTINAVNNGLNGQTGTGSFVGSDSHTLTGTLNWSGATALEVPNSASPSTTAAGHIAMDTTITDYTPLVQYHDGAATQYAIAIPSADLSTTNAQIVVYNAASDKFTLAAPSGGSSGKIVGYAIGTSTSDDTTTSGSFVDTALTASYTPISGSNSIYVFVYGAYIFDKTGGGSIPERSGSYQIARTAPSSATFATTQVGADLRSGNAGNKQMYGPLSLMAAEGAGSTSLRTYKLQFRSTTSAITSTFRGATTPGFMFIYEIA